jgi:hypothetical protein
MEQEGSVVGLIEKPLKNKEYEEQQLKSCDIVVLYQI